MKKFRIIDVTTEGKETVMVDMSIEDFLYSSTNADIYNNATTDAERKDYFFNEFSKDDVLLMVELYDKD